jgi:uncharacterized protein (DUF2267 family)
MSYEHLLSIVSDHARTSIELAARATQATLETLAERIPAEESHTLRGCLPPSVARWVSTSNPADPFDLDEFLRRVADRESVDVETAEWHARAVLEAVASAVGVREYERLEAQLPEDFRPLFDVALAASRR